GKDTLTGGAGKDSFVFSTKLGNGNVDRITDFSVQHDTMRLDKAVFKAAGRKGGLADDAFWIGTSAHDANDRMIYNDQDGKLYYDADGAGVKDAVLVAILNRGLSSMSAKDFVIF
ncbi:hypothetical protein HI113_45055, partial [Corallococcus exiguus]|nr:hypothetical protein [Corallococcus exiguus]